ncbi:MAG: hypothetical protein JRH06_10215 [Deltaproteobacteria bacterium]|nr:hypothetical protein [Deltaproteobacteria bacterium]
MRVWSKGLGNMTLNFDFDTCEANWEDDHLILTGWIRDPVVWNYRITFEDRDLRGLIRLGVSRHSLRYGMLVVLKKLFSFFNRGSEKDGEIQ